MWSVPSDHKGYINRASVGFGDEEAGESLFNKFYNQNK